MSPEISFLGIMAIVIIVGVFVFCAGVITCLLIFLFVRSIKGKKSKSLFPITEPQFTSKSAVGVGKSKRPSLDANGLPRKILNYLAYRPTIEMLNLWKPLFIRKDLYTWTERQIFDTLNAWLYDDVNSRYGDRFILMGKVPIRSLIKQQNILPEELQLALDQDVDFLICSRGTNIIPVIAIKIWAGSIGWRDSSSVITPEFKLNHRDLTPEEWQQWIGIGLVQAAGISSYLVTEGMASNWGQKDPSFFDTLEEDIKTALANSLASASVI